MDPLKPTCLTDCDFVGKKLELHRRTDFQKPWHLTSGMLYVGDVGSSCHFCMFFSVFWEVPGMSVM